MNLITRIASSLLGAALLAALPAAAADHGMHGGAMGSPATEAQLPGTQIGQKSVEGYTLAYRLLDKKQRDAVMKGMEGMEMPGMSTSPDITNHLMVFIKGADGRYASGTVGFGLTGPDGRQQKSMTMGTAGGYGADVILKAKGAYTLRMKAVIGDKTLQDDFVFEQK
jgi:hypothetical protein